MNEYLCKKWINDYVMNEWLCKGWINDYVMKGRMNDYVMNECLPRYWTNALKTSRTTPWSAKTTPGSVWIMEYTAEFIN